MVWVRSMGSRNSGKNNSPEGLAVSGGTGLSVEGAEGLAPIDDKGTFIKVPPENGPYVILDFVFDRGLFFISVQNIGVKPAFKVSIDFNKDFSGLEGKKWISKSRLFKGIEFMPPGKEIQTFLDASTPYFVRGEPTKIVATITFQDFDGKKYQYKISHDLGIYLDLGYINRIAESKIDDYD